jgi:hypothetical protein
MSDHFERELRQALRPIEPSANFAERLLARLPQVAAPSASAATPIDARTGLRKHVMRWIPAALAASLVAAVLVRHELQLRDEIEQGRIAREQLMEALRVTSEKLDVAYRAVNDQPARDLKSEPRSEPKTDETII